MSSVSVLGLVVNYEVKEEESSYWFRTSITDDSLKQKTRGGVKVTELIRKQEMDNLLTF